MRLSFFKAIFSLFVLLIITQITVIAQIVNIEEGRIGRDSSNHFAGKVGLDFSIYNQNAGKNQPNNYLQFTFNSHTSYQSQKHTYFLINYLNYLLVNYNTKSQRNTVAQQAYSHFRVNFYQAQRLSYELFAQLQVDKARGLQLRTLGGGYLRFRVTKQENKNINLFVGSGFMQEREEWFNREQAERLQTSDLLKSTSYISAKMKAHDNIEINAITYYQVGYSRLIDRFRNRVSGEISLGVNLNKVLALKTKFNCTYEDQPIVPVTKFVYTISNGIELVF